MTCSTYPVTQTDWRVCDRRHTTRMRQQLAIARAEAGLPGRHLDGNCDSDTRSTDGGFDGPLRPQEAPGSGAFQKASAVSEPGREPRCPPLRFCNGRFTSILLKNPLLWRQHLGFGALSERQIRASSPQVAKIGAGSGMRFASFRRFWAVAAKRNSSLAPLGPRRRNRSSLRMRLR